MQKEREGGRQERKRFQAGEVAYAEAGCVKGQERDDRFGLAGVWAGSWHKACKW